MKLIGSGMGSIKSRCFMATLYSVNCPKVFVFAEFGSLRFGFAVNDADVGLEEPDNEFFPIFEAREEAEASVESNEDMLESNDEDTGAESTAIENCPVMARDRTENRRHGINKKLDEIQKGNDFPYREFAAQLKKGFRGSRVVIYRFGQKELLNEERKVIFSRLATTGTLELAVAGEISIPGEFAAVELAEVGGMGFADTNSKKYSVLLSNTCGNVVAKPKAGADRHFPLPNVHRFVLYNTIQHSRKRLDFKIKIGQGVTADTFCHFVSHR